jgi:hypothetical protein
VRRATHTKDSDKMVMVCGPAVVDHVSDRLRVPTESWCVS